MQTKIIQLIPALLALLFIGFRYFSLWCIDVNSSCYGTWVHWIFLPITKPFYIFSFFFLAVAIVLAFVPREIFKSWLKFAVWAIPLSIIFIATTHVNSNAYIDFFPFYRDDAARLAGGVFATVSLVLIIYKSIALCRK